MSGVMQQPSCEQRRWRYAHTHPARWWVVEALSASGACNQLGLSGRTGKRRQLGRGYIFCQPEEGETRANIETLEGFYEVK